MVESLFSVGKVWVLFLIVLKIKKRVIWRDGIVGKVWGIEFRFLVSIYI